MPSRAYVSAFGFKGPDQQKPVNVLSGGERNRLNLAMTLKQGGNLLLLDEPTNDLDVETLGSLENALENFPGCAVVISHDRWFLDRVVHPHPGVGGHGRRPGALVLVRGQLRGLRAEQGRAPRCRRRTTAPGDAPQAHPGLRSQAAPGPTRADAEKGAVVAARRESGTPSAQTVLEVADGLRWTDPALGVSLAEHARRLAGDDDPVTRSAAERSILRSLAEADRYDDVVHRAGPLLDEARRRGDRDDAAAVVVELASAVVGLGDGPTAWTMVERLRPVDELPARVVAAAALVRTRVLAEAGDVVGTEGEAEQAVAVLLRVPEPEAGLLRREMACARGRARRRAGDLGGALAVLATATTAHPGDDPDGGRRSLAAAAEQIEVLVELGRADEARARADALVPDGPVEPALLRAVSRIRLVLAEAGGSDAVVTRAAAQALEDAGHLDDAARAWQVVAASAESRGELREALGALRHGHTLESRARDEHGRSLRGVAAVEVGNLPVAERAPEPASPTPEPAQGLSPPAPEVPGTTPSSGRHRDAVDTTATRNSRSRRLRCRPSR